MVGWSLSVNFKGFGKKVVAYLNIFSLHPSGVSDENHESLSG
jgi:hypothetical protein